VFVADDKDHVTSPLPVQTEREKEVVQQLKQATDTAARQQDELRQAADREAQLQRQLDEMKDDVSQLQMELREETDTAASLQDELRQAADRETQLQRQLDKLQTELKQETHQRQKLKEAGSLGDLSASSRSRATMSGLGDEIKNIRFLTGTKTGKIILFPLGCSNYYIGDMTPHAKNGKNRPRRAGPAKG